MYKRKIKKKKMRKLQWKKIHTALRVKEGKREKGGK